MVLTLVSRGGGTTPWSSGPPWSASSAHGLTSVAHGHTCSCEGLTRTWTGATRVARRLAMWQPTALMPGTTACRSARGAWPDGVLFGLLLGLLLVISHRRWSQTANHVPLYQRVPDLTYMCRCAGPTMSADLTALPGSVSTRAGLDFITTAPLRLVEVL